MFLFRKIHSFRPNIDLLIKGRKSISNKVLNRLEILLLARKPSEGYAFYDLGTFGLGQRISIFIKESTIKISNITLAGVSTEDSCSKEILMKLKIKLT